MMNVENYDCDGDNDVDDDDDDAGDDEDDDDDENIHFESIYRILEYHQPLSVVYK